MRKIAVACLSGVMGAAVAIGWPQSAAAQLPGWTIEVRELESGFIVSSPSVAIDGAGNVYVSGYIISSSSTDACLVKYGPDLDRLWTRRIVTEQPTRAVAVDGQGNIFLASQSGFPGNSVLAKLGPDGTPLWTRHSKSTAQDSATSVATDAAGNAFAAGWTRSSLFGHHAGTYEDGWLAKWDGHGTLLWGTQFGGVDGDFVNGTATDPEGNVFVAGDTWSSLFAPNQGSDDAFVAKYGSDGVLLWGSQFGTQGYDRVSNLASDADGNVYVTGSTSGSLFSPANGHDAFVAKLGGDDGTLLWGVQFGSIDEAPAANGVAVASDGTVYAAGSTYELLGKSDAWVARFDQDGTMIQGGQFGTTDWDNAMSIAVAGNGTVFIAGYIESDSDSKAVLARLTPVAAP